MGKIRWPEGWRLHPTDDRHPDPELHAKLMAALPEIEAALVSDLPRHPTVAAWTDYYGRCSSRASRESAAVDWRKGRDTSLGQNMPDMFDSTDIECFDPYSEPLMNNLVQVHKIPKEDVLCLVTGAGGILLLMVKIRYELKEKITLADLWRDILAGHITRTPSNLERAFEVMESLLPLGDVFRALDKRKVYDKLLVISRYCRVHASAPALSDNVLTDVPTKRKRSRTTQHGPSAEVSEVDTNGKRAKKRKGTDSYVKAAGKVKVSNLSLVRRE